MFSIRKFLTLFRNWPNLDLVNDGFPDSLHHRIVQRQFNLSGIHLFRGFYRTGVGKQQATRSNGRSVLVVSLLCEAISSSITISIDKSGQRISHNRQQMQCSGRTATTFSMVFSSNTFSGQNLTQMPQPLHQSQLIRGVLSISFLPFGPLFLIC